MTSGTALACHGGHHAESSSCATTTQFRRSVAWKQDRTGARFGAATVTPASGAKGPRAGASPLPVLAQLWMITRYPAHGHSTPGHEARLATMVGCIRAALVRVGVQVMAWRRTVVGVHVAATAPFHGCSTEPRPARCLARSESRAFPCSRSVSCCRRCSRWPPCSPSGSGSRRSHPASAPPARSRPRCSTRWRSSPAPGCPARPRPTGRRRARVGHLDAERKAPTADALLVMLGWTAVFGWLAVRMFRWE